MRRHASFRIFRVLHRVYWDFG
jgi:hypothetical protein